MNHSFFFKKNTYILCDKKSNICDENTWETNELLNAAT